MTLERADVNSFADTVELDDQQHHAETTPLSPLARARIDELFKDPLTVNYSFSQRQGLSVADVDALVSGLNEFHGAFESHADEVLLSACMGMLLRGLKKEAIAGEVGSTPSEINRRVAFYMRNVRKTVNPQREESVQRLATILAQDRAEAGRQPLWMTRAYTPRPQSVPEPIQESVKNPLPPKKQPAKKVAPKVNKAKTELDITKNRNLFTRALLRPDVEQTHLDEELSKSLRDASDNGVIPSGYKEMLLDDLSYGLKNPRIKGSAHEARRFVFELGKTFPGRLSVDSQQNITVMRGLFALYGQRGLTVEALEKAYPEKIPVRLLVAGAVTEVLNTATTATVASRNVSTHHNVK